MALASYYVYEIFPEYPLVFQVVQQVIQRLCQRNDKYRQASSGIEGYRRFNHTINWTFGYS
ncbi:hypothetical protein F383_38067 [Gossypium arboreum]|uniref:Uncharacterized protein n=1 Tax=Gossypium arboreum TaxID=29729 RepID=A0A0B0MDX9_GOSAR|nr:hypothetical protein F383_37740 [Gossypium arboreum]KHF98994.1 hypothetical protein F383_38067 [Gossypium arboreum]